MSDKYRKAAEEMVAVVLPTIEGVLVKYMRAVLEETDSHLPRSATEADAREAFQAWWCPPDHDENPSFFSHKAFAQDAWLAALRHAGAIKDPT